MSEGWSALRYLWGRLIRKEASLTPAAKMIAWAFCEQFADRHTGRCDPSIATLAEAVGYGERQAKDALKSLEAAGWLQITRGIGRGNRSAYQLTLPVGKGADILTFSKREKVHSSSIKGAPECTSHSEPTMNPKAREPWHRGHLLKIEAGSHLDRPWREWLAKEGFGGWKELQLIDQKGQILVPLTRPPDPDHPVEPGLARGWFKRRTAMIRRERDASREAG